MSKALLKNLTFENNCGVYGIPATAEDFDYDKTRYLRITDISEDGKLLDVDKKSVSSDDIEKYLLNEGDIVFARTGNSTGKTYYHEASNGRLAFAGFLIKYSLNPQKVNPKYIRYYTISNEYKTWVSNLSLGSTRGNINAKTFADCPISLPSRKQQDLLVAVLSTLDAKIELNNRINAELEAMAKLLYDYWFVQFDFPDANGNPYKSSGGKMVYNKESKREIPEGWEGKIIANIATVKAGGDKPEIFSGEKTETCSIPIFANGTIDDGLYGYTNKATVNAPSITISARGSIGYTVLRNKPFVPIIRLIVITPKNHKYTYFIYEYINSIGFGKSGSVQQQLTSPMVSNLKIVYPLEYLIKKFYRLTCRYTAMIQTIKEQNQQLIELRDWLLPMLMNGQVSVK